MIVKDLSPELRADAAFFIIHVEVRRNPVFRDLPNSALGSLVDVFKKTSAKKGENIITQGDPGVAMYVIVEGAARFSHGHQWVPHGARASTAGRAAPFDNQESSAISVKQIKKLIEGDSFGEEIIFTLEETYLYTIVAESLCSMYTLTEDAFKSRFRNMPDLFELMLSNFLKSRK